MDSSFLHGDPIYDIENESLMEVNISISNQHWDPLGVHEEDIGNPISLNLGKLEYV